MKQISIWLNKKDSDEKCDEISNEMDSMLIKICWEKHFIDKNTQPAEAVGATKCPQNSDTRREGCKYSHIPMTVNQELLSQTKHVQEQKGAITLTLFGPPRDTDKITLRQPQKGWRFDLMIHRASKHIGGHPRHTDARKGRPWVAHNTIHSATNVYNQKISTTVFNNVQKAQWHTFSIT